MAEKSKEELQLDRDRFEFEKQRFTEEKPKREAEANKLRAEQEKIRLESADLEVPYKQRPAYKAALFQGAAVFVAVLSAVISVGTVEKIIQAARAEQSATFAKERAERANVDLAKVEAAMKKAEEDKKDAERTRDAVIKDKDAANRELSSLSGQLEPLEKQISEFQNELQDERMKVALEPVREILAIEPVGAVQLRSVLTKEDAFLGKRVAFAAGYAFGDEGAVSDRLTVLSVLAKLETEKKDPDFATVHGFRNRMISLGSPPVEGDLSRWTFLVEQLSPDYAGPYICRAYERKWPASSQGDPKASLFIARWFPHYPDCIKAFWDSNDPDMLPLAGLNTGTPYIQITMALCAARPIRCVELISGGAFFAVLRQLKNKPAILKLDDFQDLQAWGRENPKTLRSLTEGGLGQLRACGIPVWDMASSQSYVDDKQLEALCPGIK